VGKTEYAKPDYKDRVIECETIKQKLFDGIGTHCGTPRFFKIDTSNYSDKTAAK
jgi:hypothetical protein